MQDGVTGPLRAERDSLKTRLDDTVSALRDMTSRCENAEEVNSHLENKVKRMDEKLMAKDQCAFPLRRCQMRESALSSNFKIGASPGWQW